MKISKREARYRDNPNITQRCERCTMFRPPHGCTAVIGRVYSWGWCRLFAAVSERKTTEAQT